MLGHPPEQVWSAPGRVNLIGEHTDYNDGLVLPFALPHRVAVAAARRDDGMLGVASIGDDGRAHRIGSLSIAALTPGTVAGWAGYPAGVAWVLEQAGLLPAELGADLVIVGNVPAGAGLSSSAALECAVALALLGIGGVALDADDVPTTAAEYPGDAAPIPATRTTDGAATCGLRATRPPLSGDRRSISRREVATLAQRAENEFVGAPTGVLDQTASLCCRQGCVLYLDVRSGTALDVPLSLTEADLTLLVIDTRAHHHLADSEYGQRRAGCERAAEALGVTALRDIDAAALPQVLAALPPELRALVRHVVTENDRVRESVRLLRRDAVASIGPALDRSHRSLREDYRVSCAELDLAVDTARQAGALGARMTGGGFGGSAIALVHHAAADDVARAVRAAFEARRLAKPVIFPAVPSRGAARDR
ncbi:MAG: galactokinase [Sciscionella sp.]